MKNPEAKGSHCRPRRGVRQPSLGTSPLPLLLTPYVSVPHSCARAHWHADLDSGVGVGRRPCLGDARPHGGPRECTARAQWEWVPGWLCSAASLRPQGPRDQWLRTGPTPSCPPGRSSARTAPSSVEGGAYTVVGGCGGVGAGSPIWGRQVWCGELLWGYVVGLRFLLGAGESIPFLPKFLLFTSLWVLCSPYSQKASCVGTSPPPMTNFTFDTPPPVQPFSLTPSQSSEKPSNEWIGPWFLWLLVTDNHKSLHQQLSQSCKGIREREPSTPGLL